MKFIPIASRSAFPAKARASIACFSSSLGGRPKMPEDLKKAMQSMAAEALDVLKVSLRSDDERIRLEAVKILFDRGYGKPSQAVDLTTRADAAGAHLQALKAMVSARQAMPSDDDTPETRH